MPLPVFDSLSAEYKKPFGAVQTGTDVVFTVCLPADLAFSEVKLRLYTDSFQEDVLLIYQKTEEDRIYYQGRFSPLHADVYFYFFSIHCNGRETYIKKDPSTGLGIVSDQGEHFQLTVYQKEYCTPDWIKGGVIYQIFPDRFCRSGLFHPNVPEDRILRSDWGGVPNFMPNENGEILNNDYFGGDLEGIRQKLPYLQSLGVSMIYLNPIFEAHANHRYNTADYLKIDPLLGSEEDFKRLCSEARSRGIRIILDGVFSHTGSDSVYFNKNGRYPLPGAYNSTESPYYKWYQFYRYPNEYQSWWGFPTLPEVKEEEPSYTEFICGQNGVIRRWLRAGASGFRLDVADELPDSFIEKIRAAVKAEGEENLLLGEVWEDASNKQGFGKHRRYFQGNELDTVMNYPFKDAILSFLQSGNKADCIRRISAIVENYPPPSLHTAMNSLSTHDTERAINLLAGKSANQHDRIWQSQNALTLAEYAMGKKKLKLAMVMQFFLPGVPCIYYGDEAGLQGYKDPFNRLCYPWGQEDEELLSHTRFLSALRHQAPALKEGSLTFLDSPSQVLAFIREDKDGVCVVAINPSDSPQELSIPIPRLHCHHGEYRHGSLLLKPYDFSVLSK